VFAKFAESATFYMLIHRIGQCEFDLVAVVIALISSHEWVNLSERKRLDHLKLFGKKHFGC
jgi:hypothetical protein